MPGERPTHHGDEHDDLPEKQPLCRHKSRPHTRSVDLTPELRNTHLPVGSNLTVTLTKRGFIGKAYVFTMRPDRQPAWKASCLAPGSSVPGKGCLSPTARRRTRRQMASAW